MITPMNHHRYGRVESSCHSKRIVVVGAAGRLGHSLVKWLESDHQVMAFDRNQLDLGSERSIHDALSGLDYDQLFITGALTGVDYCETHEAEAFAVNADGPGWIAEISAAKGAHVTYISTDMVFDGTHTEPYVESDKAFPISVYGASKLAGETRILKASSSNLVTRVSWLFGPGRPAFPDWIIAKACAEPELTLPDDKIACPTYTLDLVHWLSLLAIDGHGGPASGVFHLCNARPCTWRQWGQYCIDTARSAGFPVVAREIVGIPVDTVPAFVAKRPHNSAMQTHKFTTLTGITPRGWREATGDFVRHCQPVANNKTGVLAPGN